MRGHAWTIGGFVRDRIRPPFASSGSRPWTLTLADERFGSVRLSGWLQRVPASTSLVVIVHGLAGSAQSPYCLRAAQAATAAGMSSLRLNLRGADGLGQDFYHAGLSSDLAATLRSPELAEFSELFVLGFSLGGHVVLQLALDRPPRLKAAAAVCAPLDLSAAADAFDALGCVLYRRVILAELKAMYSRVAQQRSLPVEPERVRRVTGIRAWDDLTVARRYGFGSAERYYRQVSVGGRLSRLRVPALLVSVRRDPMVSRDSVAPSLVRASEALRVCWVQSGGDRKSVV